MMSQSALNSEVHGDPTLFINYCQSGTCRHQVNNAINSFFDDDTYLFQLGAHFVDKNCNLFGC
jgi:hypothetical protein